MSLVCAQVSFFTISILLPKALIDQGAAVTLSFGLSSLVFLASIPGKGFTGFLMEIIGRRWTITYCLAGSLPGLLMMAVAHSAGRYATVVFVAGALITGFTVLSTFTAVRVYLSEQFPTALARPRAIFWRVVRALRRRRGRAVHVGAVHRFAGDLFRYLGDCCVDWRFCSRVVWQGNRRPTRNRHRTGLTVFSGVTSGITHGEAL